jgi:pectate lyase
MGRMMLHFSPGPPKTSLVGGIDRHTEDEGRLKASDHHDLWEQTQEGSPRVRHGQVQVDNNLCVVHDAASFGHSIGLGQRAMMPSEHNAWQTPPGMPAGWRPATAPVIDPAEQAPARVCAGAGAGRLWTAHAP